MPPIIYITADGKLATNRRAAAAHAQMRGLLVKLPAPTYLTKPPAKLGCV